MKADAVAADVERLAYRAWPAEEEEAIDGWMLRRSHGISAKRLNSATSPIGRGGDVLGAEQAIRSWFAQRGAKPIVRLLSVSDAAIDRHFDAAGWVKDSPTLVMATALHGGGSGPGIRLERQLSRDWIAAKQRLTGMPGSMIETWQRRAMDIKGTTGFASVVDGNRVLAIGMGVVDDHWLGLFDLNTDSAFRRRGLARSVVEGLEEWGHGLGATDAYLQVEASNEPAIDLYANRGYEPRYEYWYRFATPTVDGGGPASGDRASSRDAGSGAAPAAR